MLSNGKYIVLFNFFDLSGNLTGQQKVGEFNIYDESIINAEGICHNMLTVGPLTPSLELRITSGLNNGYYEVRHEQPWRPKPLKKSETLTVTKGPFAKFLRAFEADLGKGLRNTIVDRRYWVPGLAGSNLEGSTTYIDSRLPESFKGYHTDKYLLIHEVTEKWLMDKLGFDYGYAHNIALAAERYAVEADGLEWNEYESFMWNFIHKYCMPHMVPKDKRPPDLDPDRITHTRTIRDIMRHSLKKSINDANIPRFATIAVINPSTKNILMGKRNDDKSWTMPGGHINDDETPENGAKRELFEETGIAAKNLKFLGKNKVKSPRGKDMMIYSFSFEHPVENLTTEHDPDNEVQGWKWVSTHQLNKIPQQVPLEKNVTLKILENKGKILQKADNISEMNGDDQPKTEYDRIEKRLEDNDHSQTPTELSEFLDEALLRRDYDSAKLVFNSPQSTDAHVQKVLNLPELMASGGMDTFGRPTHKTNKDVAVLASKALRYGKVSDNQVNDVLNKIKNNPEHPDAYSMMYYFPRNENLSLNSLKKVQNFVQQKPNYYFSTTNNEEILKRTDLDEELLKELASNKDPLIRRLAIEHPNATPSIAASLFKDINPYVRQAAADRRDMHNM
jgi:phosphatase NudJ